MLALAAALQIALSAGAGAPRPITQMVHTRWTRGDGAPAEIRALAQTRDGYLWVGSLSGLDRFDGVRFVRFTPHANDTLPAGPIRDLLASRDSSLWIVWSTGVVGHLHGGRLTTWGTHDGLPATWKLAESSTGTLVAGTVNGLSRFANGKWTDTGRRWDFPGKQAMEVWFDREDALWVETDDRMVYLPAGTHRFLDPGERLKFGSNVASMAEEKDGTIWLAEIARSAHTLRRIGGRGAASEVQVGSQHLLIDRKGSLWVASTGDGLRRVLDPRRIRGKAVTQFGPEAEHFTQVDGLLSDIVSTLLEDREGTIWVGTARGLESFREGAFTPWAMSGGYRPRSVVVGRDGWVWSAAFSMFYVFGIHAGARDSMYASWPNPRVAPDSAGVLWTIHDGDVFRVRGRTFTKVPVGRSGAHHLVDIVLDPAGTVWVFDEALGLLRLASEGLRQAAAFTQPPDVRTILFSDRRGRIWIGQDGRVALYQDGRLRMFGAAQGLASGPVRGFFEDRAGHIWIASWGGLSRLEGDRFRTLPEHDLPDRSVFGIAEDSSGASWLVTSNGVLRLPPGELDRALADSTWTPRYRTFDRRDGLAGAITEWNVGPWMGQGPSGRIWVAADTGVASVDPLTLVARAPPSALIETVRIDGHELVLSDAVTLPARSRDLEIDYTVTGSAMPDRIQFRYRLDDEDVTWSDAGTRRRAYYVGLAPGAHRFRVIASNGDGVWNESDTGAIWDFRILPAWYQTVFFRIGVVLLVGVLGAAAASLVQRRRHLAAQEALKGRYAATLAERERIAQELHDTLLQGFTGITFMLRAISRWVTDRPAEAAGQLEDVVGLAESTIRDARHMIWDIRAVELDDRELTDALESAARRAVAGSSVDFVFTVRGNRRRLALAVETAAMRICREAVLNALKHAAPHTIEVRLEYDPRMLTVKVIDDGKGIAPGTIDAALQAGHWGVSGMKTRAERVEGTLEIVSVPASGTTVCAALPVGEAQPTRAGRDS
jgi:signal transduction histidine kinase/ligand-binding sensor domain-containing protein